VGEVSQRGSRVTAEVAGTDGAHWAVVTGLEPAVPRILIWIVPLCHVIWNSAALAQQVPETTLFPLQANVDAELIPKFGYVDLTGRVVIPYRFESADRFVEGRAKIRLHNKAGFIDSHGSLVVEPKYDQTSDFSGGRAVVRVGPLSGMIDRDGREIITTQYRFVGKFSGGLAIVAKPPEGREPLRYGAIDADGRVVIDFLYENLSAFSEGRASFRRDGKMGYISDIGEVVIPPIYDFAGPFKDGMARVGVKSPSGTALVGSARASAGSTRSRAQSPNGR
jgi:WG containing repeat